MSHVLKERVRRRQINCRAAFSHNFRYFVKYSSGQNCLSLLLLQQVYYETNNKQQKKCGKKRGREVGFYPMPCALSTKIDDSYFNVHNCTSSKSAKCTP